MYVCARLHSRIHLACGDVCHVRLSGRTTSLSRAYGAGARGHSCGQPGHLAFDSRVVSSVDARTCHSCGESDGVALACPVEATAEASHVLYKTSLDADHAAMSMITLHWTAPAENASVPCAKRGTPSSVRALGRVCPTCTRCWQPRRRRLRWDAQHVRARCTLGACRPATIPLDPARPGHIWSMECLLVECPHGTLLELRCPGGATGDSSFVLVVHRTLVLLLVVTTAHLHGPAVGH